MSPSVNLGHKNNLEFDSRKSIKNQKFKISNKITTPHERLVYLTQMINPTATVNKGSQLQEAFPLIHVEDPAS